jgi:hypothetical protein
MPPPDPYVLYDDSIEVKQPNEDQLVENILASMARVNRLVFDKHRHATRDAHAKSHGIVKGTLTIYGNLPGSLSQGLFRTPREFPVVARFSSAPGDIHDDRIRAPKGIAIKVIGVEGRKLLPGMEDHLTQDFLLVNIPVLAFGHVAAYWEVQQKLEKSANNSELVQRLAGEAASAIAKTMALVGVHDETADAIGIPNHHILGETFHSMAAIRFGAYIAKISAAPLSDSVRRLTRQTIDTGSSPSAFRDHVVDFFKSQSAEYELRAQLCTDLGRMPVEDASVEWPEALSPHQPIAKLTFPPQDAYSPARRVFADDILSFNPWHCIEDHRPLGSIMRIRIPAYEQSSRFRHEMNAQPRVEPRNVSEVPD